MLRPTSIPARRWDIAPAAPPEYLAALAPLSPVLGQILYNRGLSQPGDIQSFLEKRYLASTDPFGLPDMDRAVARIQAALAGGETVIVYGDFDADGVTATVLLVEALRGLGFDRGQAQPYIPDRIDEGYGLNKEALTFLKEEKGADLVISVDCGIRSSAEVKHAAAMGLDMIVTDHHSLGPELPPALAVINPKRPDSTYPEKMLAGVGIAYKLAEALWARRPDPAPFALDRLLDLVALGTVADLAPLLQENRVLVDRGLAVLNGAERPGVAALADAAGLKPGSLTAESIAFGLGPRINAAGRLDHAYKAARLLASNNSLTARTLADELNALNIQRQRLTRQFSDQAEALIDPQSDLLFVAADNFLPGIVGLVASRLAEAYYRPAIVIEQGPDESRGSCRSITEVHITEVLDEAADLLVHYGGHAQAAGLTVRNENLPALQARLQQAVARRIQGLELLPTLAVDAAVELATIDWAFYEHLQQLEPTGYANPRPVFASRRVQVLTHRAVGQDGHHLQLEVSDGSAGFRAIAFRQGAWAGQLPHYVDIAFTVGINEWRGNRSLQLMIEDIQPAGE